MDAGAAGATAAVATAADGVIGGGDRGQRAEGEAAAAAAPHARTCYFLLKSCDEHEFIVDVAAIGGACRAFRPLMDSARAAAAVVDDAPVDFEWRETRMRRIRLKEQCFTQHVVERLLRFILIDRQDVDACDLDFHAESSLDPDFALRCLAAADFLQCTSFMQATIKKLVGPWLVHVEQNFGKSGVRRAVRRRIPPHLYVPVLSGVVSDVCFALYSKDLSLFEAGANSSVSASGVGSKKKTLLSRAEWEAVWASHYTKCGMALAGSIECHVMLPHPLAVLYDDAEHLETKRPGRAAHLMAGHHDTNEDNAEGEMEEKISTPRVDDDNEDKEANEEAPPLLAGFQLCYSELQKLIRYMKTPSRYRLSNLPAAEAEDTSEKEPPNNGSVHVASSRSPPPCAPLPFSRSSTLVIFPAFCWS